MCTNYFKNADITPDVVLAGDSVEMTIKLVAGPDFSANKSRIILDMPAYLGYSRPNCLHQEVDGFTEVFCSNPDIRYRKRIWDIEVDDFASLSKAGFKGMAQRMFVLELLEGEAGEDDEILIKIGYTCNGYGTGMKVSSLVLSREFYNTVHIRYFKDGTKGLPDYARSYKGYDRPVPDIEIPIRFRILPREPEALRLIRKKDEARLVILDRFANVCQTQRISDFVNEDVEADINSYGVFKLKNPHIKLSSKKLPLYETPSMFNVFEGYNVYFGDLHSHSSYSNDCIEREKQEMTPDMLFDFARNVANLDFMAITDHHQPWDIERNKIGEENWKKTLCAVENSTENGEFIAFPGFEFRCERGDTAVILNETFPYKDIDIVDIKNIKDLWDSFKGRNYITIPHFHNPGNMKENEWHKCPYEGVEPNLEIYSCHGSYENGDVLERRIAEIKKFRNDRNGKYFIQNGYHYGFTCNSDGHKGHAGQNGLTAVYSRELTADAIINALRKRHVYGTTNARIRLLFTINGYLMGSVRANEKNKQIYISLAGERPIKVVDIYKNGEVYKRFTPKSVLFDTYFDVNCEEPSNWYVRAVQIDNHIAYSSPIWFE